jgi:hypothetical protein
LERLDNVMCELSPSRARQQNKLHSSLLDSGETPLGVLFQKWLQRLLCVRAVAPDQVGLTLPIRSI